MGRTAKLLYACTLLALPAMVAGNASDARAQQTWVGVQAGGVSSDLSPAQEWKASRSYAAGAFAQMRVARSFYLATELTYTGLGAHEDGGPESMEFRYGQVMVPLIGIVESPPESARLLPMVFAGPYVGLRTSCEVRRADPGQAWKSCAQGTSDYGSKEPRTVEPGIVWGVGADVRMGGSRLRFQLRRQDALLSSMAQDPFFSRPPRNVSYVATAGWAVRLGGRRGSGRQ